MKIITARQSSTREITWYLPGQKTYKVYFWVPPTRLVRSLAEKMLYYSKVSSSLLRYKVSWLNILFAIYHTPCRTYSKKRKFANSCDGAFMCSKNIVYSGFTTNSHFARASHKSVAYPLHRSLLSLTARWLSAHIASRLYYWLASTKLAGCSTDVSLNRYTIIYSLFSTTYNSYSN